jgi:hypothetical protein
MLPARMRGRQSAAGRGVHATGGVTMPRALDTSAALVQASNGPGSEEVPPEKVPPADSSCLRVAECRPRRLAERTLPPSYVTLGKENHAKT